MVLRPVTEIGTQIQVEGPMKNLVLPTNFVKPLPVGDVTPSVKNIKYAKFQNTGTLVITNFDDGQEGQSLTVIGDGFSIIAENTHIQNATGFETVTVLGVAYMFVYIDGKWRQIEGTGGASANNGIAIRLVDWNFNPIVNTPLNRSSWVASASATGGSTTVGMAIDGNSSTRWATGAAIVPGTTFWAADMGSAQAVAAFHIENGSDTGDFPKSGNVQYSDDGTTWTTIDSWTLADIVGATLTRSWTPQTHRYWRLLAQDVANGASTNWMSIYEINFYSTPYVAPTWFAANQNWITGPQQSLVFRGVFTKEAVTNDFGIAAGIDKNNQYGLWWALSSSSLLLCKWVAGVRTTLATMTFDSDTNPHEFELRIITGSNSSQGNWIVVKATRGNNPPVSVGVIDTTIDLTSSGNGTFNVFGINDHDARGCDYLQLPATDAQDVFCTIATGGVITQEGNYRVHTFTANDTFEIFSVGLGLLDCFVLSGGGGGGTGSAHDGGGGAGGAMAFSVPLAIGSYAVTVGNGGPAGTSGIASNLHIAGTDHSPAPGSSSNGFAGSSGAVTGIPGYTGGKSGGANGSVGGGSPVSGVGAGGGGGGANSAGQNATINPTYPFSGAGGNGGDGIPAGAGWFGGPYAGGGGGGGEHTGAGVITFAPGNVYGGGAAGADASPNTGSGGGGPIEGGVGGAGAAGIVKVRYLYDPSKCG